MTKYLLILITLSALSMASDQIPGAPQSRPILIKGAAIHTMAGATIENGMILFEDGKITAVGETVDAPADAEIIDGAGKHVYPGLIEPLTRLGLYEVNAVRATLDYDETGDITPEVRPERAFNPDSERIPVARQTGIAVAGLGPRGGTLPGLLSTVYLDGWTYEEMTLKAPTGLLVHWPAIYGWPLPTEKKREEQLAELKQAFREARAYFTAAQARDDIDYDARWRAMMPTFAGEQKLFVVAPTYRSVVEAVHFFQEQDLEIVLICNASAMPALDLLKESKVAVIQENAYALPPRRDLAYNSSYRFASQLRDAGIQAGLAYDSGSAEDQNLPFQLGQIVAHGYPQDEVMKLLTINNAKIMGIDDRVGSLEVGKDATLFISDGDPTEVISQVEHMFIQGKVVDLTNRHTQLYEKYRTRYQQRSQN